LVEAATPERPNIIYVLADDLGYGDLSCYGQQQLRTPQLDRMAQEGMRFERHYAGSTVCAPSRCVLMTGRHTGHATVRGNGPAQLTERDICFPQLLQKAGYRTGCFGKWGIGNPPPLDDPNRHGFDEFYGYVNMFHAHNYFPEFLVHNGRKETLRNRLYEHWRGQRTGPREGAGVAEVAVDYAPALIADRALSFIREHHQQPFFVYYALNIPHANNEAGGEPAIERNGMRVPDVGEFKSKPWPIQEQGFATMMQAIDRDMGRILDLLQELKIDDRTLVLFSSDNGPHQEGGHRVDFFDSNGPLRGKKRDLYEGGVRVPMIARWPGVVKAGQVARQLTGFPDIFPTVLELSGLTSDLPLDGASLAGILTGADNREIHDHLYWEFQEQGGKRAVVDRRWKLVELDTDTPAKTRFELYDLEQDAAEERDVAKTHPAEVRRLQSWLRQAHTDTP
ncbi:MAG: arylsulfatase, partial [Planctomycetales bacterium]|nr:arylsulfatase [Planctomycetales bacterium]